MSEVKIEASYFTVRSPRPGAKVYRTVEVRPDLQVDLDEHGCVLGIERIGGAVEAGDLAAVLRRTTLIGFAP